MARFSLPPSLAEPRSRSAYVRRMESAERRRPLHESNVFARARREALRRHGIILRKTKPGTRRCRELGRYYTVNEESDFIEATHVRLEDAAVELGVIQPGEKILPG
jgi:hypothetical protein